MRLTMVVEEILIVNDGSLFLKMMGCLLEYKGRRCILTDSPEEALTLLSSRNIILAVIKLNGQQADRLALLHIVKELDAGTRLIIMSDQVCLPTECFEVKADDYLVPPCRIAEIWRRLTSYLEPPVYKSAVSSEESLEPPVNQGVPHNQSFILTNIRGHEDPGPQAGWWV